MYSVFAEGIKVSKKAGVYSEELLVENQFSVSIKVIFAEKPQTIPDYEFLVDTVLQAANQGFKWLEDWAENIFLLLIPVTKLCTVQLKITKHNPAFANKFVQAVGVEFEREFF